MGLTNNFKLTGKRQGNNFFRRNLMHLIYFIIEAQVNPNTR